MRLLSGRLAPAVHRRKTGAGPPAPRHASASGQPAGGSWTSSSRTHSHGLFTCVCTAAPRGHGAQFAEPCVIVNGRRRRPPRVRSPRWTGGPAGELQSRGWWPAGGGDDWSPRSISGMEAAGRRTPAGQSSRPCAGWERSSGRTEFPASALPRGHPGDLPGELGRQATSGVVGVAETGSRATADSGLPPAAREKPDLRCPVHWCG